MCKFISRRQARTGFNQVEVWFSILQGQSLCGASFTSLKQLEQHIDAYIKAYNDKAEPFVWTKKIRQRRFQDERLKSLIESKYPGALGIGPLDAAIRSANAILRTIGHLRVADQRHRFIWSRRLSSSNAGACAQLALPNLLGLRIDAIPR
jgi:hypothetical protein